MRFFKGQIILGTCYGHTDEYEVIDTYVEYDKNNELFICVNDSYPFIKPLDRTDPNVIASLAPDEAKYISCDFEGCWCSWIDKPYPELSCLEWQAKRKFKELFETPNSILTWSFNTGILHRDWTKEIYEITEAGVKRVEE